MSIATKNILIAPLNWGLGHATRCIPIIKALLAHHYNPIIASDGMALALLQKEFPTLKTLELPSYHIEYPKNGKNFKWLLLKNLPKSLKAIRLEKKIIDNWIEKFALNGIISDNRLGVYSSKIPSVYITHQLQVLSGNTTWISSKWHQIVIKKFAECWVPDIAGTPNLSGKLGHVTTATTSLIIKYIGVLSRFQNATIPKRYDLMVILSGPEPQRQLLENYLKTEIRNFQGNIVFIKGVVEQIQIKEQLNNVTYYNFMNSKQLEQTFNESDKILCRSGYTTIMDLVKLNKKAFFIPTPGQFEQEYLAKKLKKDGFFPYSNQKDFKIFDLNEIDGYTQCSMNNNEIDWDVLFQVFEGKM